MAKPPLHKDWAKRIRDLMEAADVAAEDLAAHMGVDRSAVYHWRRGTRIPRRELQQKLAKRLGVSVATLNGWAA